YIWERSSYAYLSLQILHRSLWWVACVLFGIFLYRFYRQDEHKRRVILTQYHTLIKQKRLDRFRLLQLYYWYVAILDAANDPGYTTSICCIFVLEDGQCRTSLLRIRVSRL
ncbi:hypothetical protein LINPERHAP1_LOCUS31587, partial [Linum perenne]